MSAAASASPSPNAEKLDLITLVQDVKELVSPPDICARLMALVDTPESGAKDFAEVVTRDPNLVARLLRIVNSPYYGLANRVDTVSRAVTVIGTRELYSLVVAVSAVQSFSEFDSDVLNTETFWRHSILCGLIARTLSKKLTEAHPERLFVAGLLHDVGALILCRRLPEVMADLCAACGGDEDELYHAEVALLGFSHVDVGAELFRLWHLPEPLQEAATAHHLSFCDESIGQDGAVIRLADQMANQSDLGSLFGELGSASRKNDGQFVVPDLDKAPFDTQSLDLNAIMDESCVQFTETVKFLRTKK